VSTAIQPAARGWSRSSWATFIVGAVAVGALFWQFGFDELLAALSRAHPVGLVATLAVGTCVRLGYALRWRSSARAFGLRAAFTKIVQARLAGDALGAVIPAGRVGGDPLRVALLCGSKDKMTVATASVALDRIMEWIGNTCYAIASVTIFAVSRAAIFDRTIEWLIFTLVLLLLTLIAPLALLRLGFHPLGLLHALASRWSDRSRRWVALIYETETRMIEFFRSHRRTFTVGTLGSLLIEALIVLEYHLLFGAFGIHLDLPTLMMVIVTGGLARGVPMPAGIGVLETTEVGLLAVAAGDASLGLVVAVVLRLHEFFWVTIGFFALWLHGGLERLRLSVSAGKAAA
jgi:uncharacterized protein (TIRG00374 family)